MIKDFDYYNFDIVKFSNEMQHGDIFGLDYIKDTIIKNIREELEKEDIDKYSYNDYINNLYSSVRCLNECVFIYECTDVKNNFNYDLYCDARDLLLDALGIEYNFDYDIYQFKEVEQ